jgi:hypothetical protein
MGHGVGAIAHPNQAQLPFVRVECLNGEVDGLLVAGRLLETRLATCSNRLTEHRVRPAVGSAKPPGGAGAQMPADAQAATARRGFLKKHRPDRE